MVGQKIFAACAPGLEALTAEELRLLGYLPAKAEAGREWTGKAAGFETAGGGVEMSLAEAGGAGETAHSQLEAIYRLNLRLRTASRVLLRVGEFYAAAFSELRKKAGRLEWERYLAPGQPVALRVTCRQSRLYHSGAVAERVLGAIADRLGSPPPAARFDEELSGKLPQLVVVRLQQNQATVSIDSSGEHLHRRGYRLASAKAPLRETLAAAMLLGSGWDRISPLIDPFCGSGTIPIEAALLAKDLAPGRNRRFAFMDWPDFDRDLFESLKGPYSTASGTATAAADRSAASFASDPAAETYSDGPRILGSDRDLGAIAMAKENAARAGISASIEFSHLAISAVEPPSRPGWVVTNPPYGLRVSAEKDLRNLYAQLGKVLRLKCPGWQYAVLCSDERLFSHSGFRPNARLSFENGGVPVRLYCGTVQG